MIRRLYIHNFRCLENFELSLGDKRSALLLGRNGTGKSTIGLALELFQSIGRGINRVGDLIKPRDFPAGREAQVMRFEIDVNFDGKSFSYSIAFDFPQRFRELRVLEEKLNVSGQPVFTRELAEVRIARSDNATGYIHFGIDWHLVALSIVQDQSPDDPLSIFKTWLKNILILRPVPNLFKGVTNEEESNLSAIDPRGVAIGPWFTDIVATSPETYSVISNCLTMVMPDFGRITNNAIGKSIRNLIFHFKRQNQEQKLDLDQLSDGEKCFVLYSLVIAASDVHRPLLCFWDEPDNFLSPNEVGHLIMDLRRYFEKNGQILITSHNPEAIRRFSDDNTFYLERKSRLEPTTCKTVGKMREDGDYEGSFVDALVRGDIGARIDG